jgi:hypothetical protein
MIERIAGKHTLGLFSLIFLILSAFPAIGYAQCEATLEWDHSSSKVEGYYVFGREEGQDYDYDEPWWQGDRSFKDCIIEELEEDRTYFFVVRAYSGAAMSADSNEVRFSYENISDDDSSSLSNGTDSSGSSSSFGGSSGGCFIGGLLDSE